MKLNYIFVSPKSELRDVDVMRKLYSHSSLLHYFSVFARYGLFTVPDNRHSKSVPYR